GPAVRISGRAISASMSARVAPSMDQLSFIRRSANDLRPIFRPRAGIHEGVRCANFRREVRRFFQSEGRTQMAFTARKLKKGLFEVVGLEQYLETKFSQWAKKLGFAKAAAPV